MNWFIATQQCPNSAIENTFRAIIIAASAVLAGTHISSFKADLYLGEGLTELKLPGLISFAGGAIAPSSEGGAGSGAGCPPRLETTKA